MRLPRLSCLFPRNDGWMGHCEEARHSNLFVFCFNSWDYHVFRSSFLVITVGCGIARRHEMAICLLLVSFMRLPRLSFLFPRNDGRIHHCEEARRANLLVSQFQIMRLLRSYFPRNDGGLRHWEEARRGNLFVFSFNSWDYFGHTFLVIRWVAALRGGTKWQSVCF